ncbi:hypothetical protein EMCRGX_G019125 [Ephydatia muelleri]
MQGARTLLSLTKFGFTCTAKIKEPEVAACNNIGDIGVASAPEIPNGTNASTSVVWGPDDCYSSVRQITASAATSRGSTAKTASKRAVDTSTNSPTSKKKKLASDCSNNPVSCYRSSCGSAASTVVIGTTTNASKILASGSSSTVANGTNVLHTRMTSIGTMIAVRATFAFSKMLIPLNNMGVEVERKLSRRVGLRPMAGLSGPKKQMPCSAIHVGSSIPRGTMSGLRVDTAILRSAEGSLVKHANSLDHKAAEVCLCNIKLKKEMELLSALAGPVHASKVALEKKSTREYLKIMLQAVAFLAAGGLAFRGHDESSNKGNFLRLLDLLASVSPDFAKQRERCPDNAKYTSPDSWCSLSGMQWTRRLENSLVMILVSVLPYSSAACERNFSGLKFVKNRLRCTIGDDFLDDLLTMLVENDLVDAILKADDSDTSFTQAINYFATQFGKRREKM